MHGLPSAVRRCALGLVSLGCAGAVFAPAGSASSQVLIQVRSIVVSATPVDRAPAGTGKGDTIVMRDRLVNAAAQFGRRVGATIGSDTAVLRFTSAKSYRMVGTAHLPGGTVTVALRGTLGEPSAPLVVTGGTGRFAHASGAVIIAGVLNTYKLMLPGS
jgi:hypothetical protein